MRTFATAIAACLPFALGLGATDFPRAETFLGYDFVRFNPDSKFIPSFNANGGSGQFVYNFDSWLGVVTDISAVNKGVLNGFDVDTTVLQFVAGPRVTLHNHGRFTPFVEVMFGGAYGTTSAQVSALPVGSTLPGIVRDANVPISARFVASHTGFAMMAGGGVDYKFNKHIAFRPFAADYDLVRLPTLVNGVDRNRNNWRISAGVNFLFGHE